MHGAYGDYSGFDTFQWGDPAIADYAGTAAVVTGDVPAVTAARYASTHPEVDAPFASMAGFNPAEYLKGSLANPFNLPASVSAAAGIPNPQNLLRDGLIGVGALALVVLGTWALVKG